MEDGVDRRFADGHGDAEDFVLLDAGFLRHFLCHLLDPVHAVQRGLERISNPACL